MHLAPASSRSTTSWQYKPWQLRETQVLYLPHMDVAMKHLKTRISQYLALLPGMASPERCSSTSITLLRLPPELILLVCDFLPSLDIICLSLCNHRLYEQYRRYFQSRPPTEDEKVLISVRLGQDYPAYFPCTICKNSHRYDGSESFGLSGPDSDIPCRLPCVRRGVRKGNKTWLESLFSTRKENWLGPSSTLRTHRRRDFILDNISFLQLKLAMRRFYYGSNFGINIESLSYTQVRCFRRCPGGLECTALFSRDAQICPEPLGLCVRMQDIVQCIEVFCMFLDESLKVYNTCIHRDPIERLSSLLDSCRPGQQFSLFDRCERCNTASLIQSIWSVPCTTFIMTRWVHLGPCLNPEDPRWKIHVNFTPSRPAKLPSSLRVQDPRSCFEAMSLQSHEDLLDRNSSYLKDKQYQKGEPFVSAGQGIWYIPYRSSWRSSKRLGNDMIFIRSHLAVYGYDMDKDLVRQK